MPAKVLTLGRPVYRGYMPIDLPQHRPRSKIKPWWRVAGKPRVTIFPHKEVEGWSETAEYPPINDASPMGLKRQPRLDWYEKLKKIPTADAKLYEINRHCQHHMPHINNYLSVNNSLPMVQYLTQTHVINKLPDSYMPLTIGSDLHNEKAANNSIPSKSTADADKISRIKKLLLNQIALEKYESQKVTNCFISQPLRDANHSQYVQASLVQSLVSGLRRALAPDVNQELIDYQIDSSPAIRSWWYHSGFKPLKDKHSHYGKLQIDGKCSQIIQCNGRAALNFRSEHLLEPELDINDELVTNTSLIEEQNYPLHYYKATFKWKWPVALPGFWFEDKPKYDCPHTCFLTTDTLETRNKAYHNFALPLSDSEDALNSQAILTGFSWLNSLSMYHGYTPFQEIDYPFTCQVISTDGQNWLFNVFQMNCHAFHRDLGGPQRNNICWSSGLMKLYDEYKGDGQFSAINEQVLHLILRFFSRQTSPAYTHSLNMRPYLGTDTRSDEEKATTMLELRKTFEGRNNKWLSKEWFVPMFEHIYFRSPQSRGQIRHMKARWHIPRPERPNIFE